MSENEKELRGKIEKLRILVVEDNAIDTELMKTHLTKMGFKNLQFATNGKEGAFKINTAVDIKKGFHILLTDWKMAQTDGLTLIKMVRTDKRLKNLFIIMVTSVDEKESVTEALISGVDDFIIKPVDPKILSEKILKLVNRIK